MATDDERREVARRLREKKAECEERGYPWMCDDLILALGYDHDYEAGDEIFDRLADLIEPSPSCELWDAEEQECYSVRTVRPVDRDALLALADGLSLSAETGVCIVHSSCLRCPGDDDPDDMLGCYREIANTVARRIREALGVEDGR